MATRKRKKLSFATELFIVIAIFLAIIIISGGIPEAAEFFKPGKVTLPSGIKGCVRGTPTISPYNSPQYGAPGQKLNFYFNFSNTDSADCKETTMEFTFNCPPELFCFVKRLRVPGIPAPTSDYLYNQVTAELGTPAGTYNFTATVTNLDNNKSATATAQYIIGAGGGGGGGGGCLKPPCQVTQ